MNEACWMMVLGAAGSTAEKPLRIFSKKAIKIVDNNTIELK